MFDASSANETREGLHATPGATAPGPLVGRLELALMAGSPRAALDRLYQHQPLRCLFPRPARGEPFTAVIANTAGGVVGGDRHSVTVTCGPQTAALVTGQAAEKVYRSAGLESRIDVELNVGPDSWLEWLPQGTILFDRSRLRRRTDLNVHPNGRLSAGEVLIFGRVAMGEVLSRGFLHDVWTVRVGGRLVWTDAIHLVGDISRSLASTGGFAGARALATFLHVGADAKTLVEAARGLLERTGAAPEVRAACTAFDNLLLVRWLGPDPAEVRQSLGAFWAAFRALAGSRPGTLPTLWRI